MGSRDERGFEAKRTPGPAPGDRDASFVPTRLPAPTRPPELVRTDKRRKTPRAGALVLPHRRAELLHVFAHHELQAAELFAWAILAFADAPEPFVRGLAALAIDEARHFTAYERELTRLGHPFGSFPVRDWFWERAPGLEGPGAFCAFVGLGLESANLDHGRRFEEELRAAGDHDAADLTALIAREEIAHVRFSVRWFRHFAGALDLPSFVAALPSPLSPILFRGRPLDRRARLDAGWPPEMIDALELSATAAMNVRAFVLNFDAEMELEAGRRYQPTRAVRERVVALAVAMRSSLPAGSVVIDPLGEAAPPDAQPIAWCPTPRARAAFVAAGVRAPEGPQTAVLAGVNDRRFAFALGADELAGSVLATDLETARAALARPGAWLLKRCFGVSGRGQRPVHGGAATEADEAFVRASLARHGALVIEPRVAIRRELSVHAWATDTGVLVRSIRAPETDAQGAFVASALVDALEPAIRAPLEATARRVGQALREAGYVGPFGVDAFEHEGGLRTLSEINARFCMGWDERDGWAPPV